MTMKARRSRIDGAKLRRLREEHALTIEQLAIETEKRARAEGKQGISAKTIGRLERGGFAQPYTLERVADALGEDPKELLGDGASEESLLSKHLCDFSDYIEDRTKDFIGRGYVLDAIDEFVANNDCGYFFVKGDPGIGKSAIAAHLVANRGFIHHFNIRAEGINSPELFMRNICAQLITEYNLDYQELPSDVVADNQFLVKLLKEAAEQCDADNKLMIVVDALDEVDMAALQPGANLLYLPPLLPSGVFFIATSRREPLQLRMECSHDKFDLEADLPENKKDIEAYLANQVSRGSIHAYIKKRRVSKKRFISAMKNKSQGNFMYLRYVLPEIVEGDYRDLEFDELPTGLQNYYEDHWRRMGMMAKPLPERKVKIIYILSEVHRPVSRELLAEFAKERAIQIQEVLDEWDQFLHKQVKDGTMRFSIYHNSFRDFLNRRDIIQAARIDIGDINDSISDAFFPEDDD